MMYRVSTIAIPTALLASAASSACAPTDWAGAPQAPTSPAADDGRVEPLTGEQATPATAVQDWSQLPPTRETIVPSVTEVSARWVLPPSNPWAPYQKTTLLMTLDDDVRTGQLPDVEALDVVSTARQAAELVAAVGLPPRTMWVVDLRGPASVAFGATLSSRSREPVSPIMTFNNWPADNESIPVEETLSALVTMKPRLPSARHPSVPVFMLDAWRLAYRDERPDDETTDNRYMLTSSDLPDSATLRARGIDQVLYVVESLDRSQLEEDDLHQAFLDYANSGITVSIVDLAQLGARDDRQVTAYWGQPLFIDSGRVLLTCDPSFYHRARGGFGGTHVVYGGGHGFAGAYGFVFGVHGGG